MLIRPPVHSSRDDDGGASARLSAPMPPLLLALPLRVLPLPELLLLLVLLPLPTLLLLLVLAHLLLLLLLMSPACPWPTCCHTRCRPCCRS